MNLKKLRGQLEAHEGRRDHLYKCSAGKLTIGIGHNIEDNGLSDAVIDLIFAEDISDVITDLSRIIPRLTLLPENVQLVLADMRFQLGGPRFQGFEDMIEAVKAEDWPGMLHEMKDSKWYRERQVSGELRVNTLIEMIEGVIRAR